MTLTGPWIREAGSCYSVGKIGNGTMCAHIEPFHFSMRIRWHT